MKRLKNTRCDFVPVLLGSDINVYGMARAFHEAYGMTSRVYAHFHLAPTRFSKIVDMHIVPKFDQRDVFLSTLIEYGKQVTEQGKIPLVISCGDVYSSLLASCSAELRPYYRFHALSPELAQKLSYKTTFYQLCEEHQLPHPATFVLTRQGASRDEHHQMPFSFPVAMKPANSVEWIDIDFEGRKKAFIVYSQEELNSLVAKSYQAGYTSEMIIQDFIPGDDSHMRVLNAYVDQHHRVRMMFLGHPLLEDPSPIAVGNYAAIMPDFNEHVFVPIKTFLEKIGYAGVANFDMKYDERDGEYKLFEINLRQGRSSYFVTLNGYNLATLFTQDLIDDASNALKNPCTSQIEGDTPSDSVGDQKGYEDTDPGVETVYGRGNKLWMEIPRSVFKKYVKDGPDKRLALKMIDRGQWGSTLRYRHDMNPARWFLLRRMYKNYERGYAQYFRTK